MGRLGGRLRQGKLLRRTLGDGDGRLAVHIKALIDEPFPLRHELAIPRCCVLCCVRSPFLENHELPSCRCEGDRFSKRFRDRVLEQEPEVVVQFIAALNQVGRRSWGL